MPAPRANRCPHCWASLPESVGPQCFHCGRSLVDLGRKARKAAQREAAPAPEPQPVSAGVSAPAASPWESAAVDVSSSAPGWEPQGWEPPDGSWAAPEVHDAPLPAPPVDLPPPPATGPARNPWKYVAAGAAALVAFVGVGALITVAQDAVDGTSDKVVASEPVSYRGPGFSVRLPGQPKVEERLEGELRITAYMFSDRDSATGVAVTPLPPGVPFDLDAAARGIVARIGGSMTSTPADVGGRPAIDVYVSNAQEGAATAWYRVIVDGSTVYQVMTVAQGDHAEPTADHRAAVDSFVIG